MATQNNISQTTLQLINDIDIVKVIDALGFEIIRRRKFICPFHNDTKPSMSISHRLNICHCFVCGETHDGISLVMKMRNLDFHDAVLWIASLENITVDYDDNSCTSADSSRPQRPEREPQCLDASMVHKRQSAQSDFCRALVANGILSAQQVEHAVEQYHLGTSRTQNVIFWQIDNNHRLRDGKIMHYLPSCHRDHQHNPTWIAHIMRQNRLIGQDFESEKCLFGLHLLKPDAKPLVAVVESEKTAVICSERIPSAKELRKWIAVPASHHDAPIVWLATGGMSFLNAERLRPLNGYTVVIFPDTDTTGTAFNTWKEAIVNAEKCLGRSFYFCDILEQCATPEQKQRKVDIADFFFNL